MASGSAACKLRALAMLVLCLMVGLQETGPTWIPLISLWKKLAYYRATRSQLCRTVWTFLWSINCIQFCTTRASRWQRLLGFVFLYDIFSILWSADYTFDLLHRQGFEIICGPSLRVCCRFKYVVTCWKQIHKAMAVVASNQTTGKVIVTSNANSNVDKAKE